MNDKQVEQKRKQADYLNVGMMFPASILVGGFMGYYLDQWLNTHPYLLFFFILIGVAAGFVNLIRVTNVSPRQKKEKKNQVDNGKC
jgi:ATP synthase protein I